MMDLSRILSACDMRRVKAVFSVLGTGLILMTCLLLPACSPLNLAHGNNETRELVQGQGFRHLVLTRYFHDAAISGQQPVFVFVENDGLPWQTPTVVSNDPTPRRPVALGLFRKTDAPAIYLGRPCQWVGTFEPPCHPYFWTHGRFHPDVVNSLIAALEKVLHDDKRPLILVGHSGGGALAVLIAHSLKRPVAVVTLAAVLDHQKWATRLALSPLMGSLNPATAPPRSYAALAELHVFGALDEVVKSDDAAAYLNRFPSETLSLPQADHNCCWENWWAAEGLDHAKRLALAR